LGNYLSYSTENNELDGEITHKKINKLLINNYPYKKNKMELNEYTIEIINVRNEKAKL